MRPITVLAGVATVSVLLAAAGAGRAAQPRPTGARPGAWAVDAKLPDVVETLSPSAVRLQGYLGARVAANEANRLLAVNEADILAGFRRRPGSQAWIGEHVGKFLHAGTLAWANTDDPKLREKLDRVVRELLKTQEPDGYLGTYTADKRFGLYPGADWDVWVHKYNLLGLLTYHRYTGDKAALASCRRMGDLLVKTFGPSKKSILAAGTHVGMASTSVLEPIVLLYRATGDVRYLDFARYLVRSWDEPNGPKVMTTLLTEKQVEKTANGKAYEMLSNLVGLCELARATGDRKYLVPAVNAWEDITRHHLYLTGSASSFEHFHKDDVLPNQTSANVGETCVTVTWIQLNAQLLRLTGEARYADELERSYYNHLAGAQRPDGREWCYYTGLEGAKPYGPGINCCVSSGPRGMAMAPELAFGKRTQAGRDHLIVNLFEAGRATLRLGGQNVTVEQTTEFPRRGGSILTLRLVKPATFGLQVRSPAWAQALRLKATGQDKEVRGPQGGWVVLAPRAWKDGDRVTIDFPVPARVVPGTHTNAGRSALMWGPIVLAYDTARNPGLPAPAALKLSDRIGKPAVLPVPGAAFAFTAPVQSARDPEAQPAVFVPFAEAGSGGGRYQVWLRAPGSPLPVGSLFAGGEESRSRAGNVAGAIGDDDPDTFVVTFDGEKRDEDWFAVQTDRPMPIRRVVFAHGQTFHDGGWFDTSAGKPRVQVQRAKGAAWETVGTLDEYPATTGVRSGGLKPGQRFTLRLTNPVPVLALRVIGRPASGDNPAQAFASCAEIQAFSD